MALSGFRNRSTARRVRALRRNAARRRRGGFQWRYRVAFLAALLTFGFLFRLALVLQKGAAGYSVLLQPLREKGEAGAALAALLAPDALTLSIATALAPLI